jgi:hypothetical protein
MIIILDKPSADVGRFVSINNLHERYPGHAISFLDNCNLSNMGLNETLYLLSHGSEDGTVGLGRDMTPLQLAKKLLKRGLQTRTKIETGACYTGLKPHGVDA